MLPAVQVHSLYVGNLAQDVDDQQLRELFEQFGSVQSTKICRDQDKNGIGLEKKID